MSQISPHYIPVFYSDALSNPENTLSLHTVRDCITRLNNTLIAQGEAAKTDDVQRAYRVIVREEAKKAVTELRAFLKDYVDLGKSIERLIE